MIEDQPQGLAFLCDLQGLILQVLRNDLNLENAAPGQLFFNLAESASRAKAMNFLIELKSQGAVLDWEINITADDGILLLHFTGGLAGNSLLIAASVSGQSAERLYDDLFSINNEQINLLRAVLKDKMDMSRAASDVMYDYDEISRLNNELVSTQRELAKLNSELEQRVAERTQELRDAQEKIIRQEKLAVLGQMAGSVGHELRNPLGVMSNAVYFLKMIQPDAPDKVREYLNLIEKNIRISNKIVGDLLDFTRVKSVDRVPVSVSNLICHTLERFPAPESVRVEIDVAPSLPQAYADPQHVIQVLGNLTLNACQSMDSAAEGMAGAQKAGNLTISACAQGDMIRIAVRDTGAGIPPENMKKLFEPLFTTKTKGIGLGLAVSQKLIEANGGRIEVQSEVGVGSTFILCLPTQR
jgi:signal transduction histidine kinase